MPATGAVSTSEVDRDPEQSARRRTYTGAFLKFAEALPAKTRARINGSGSPDWPSSRTFALPVNADSTAYRTEEADPVIETLNEISQLRGALPKIALWLKDRCEVMEGVGGLEV